MSKSRVAQEVDEILKGPHQQPQDSWAHRAKSKIISHDTLTNTYVVESSKMAYVAAEEVGLRHPRLITESTVGDGIKHWVFKAAP